MKIGFDISQLAYKGGVAEYTYYLAKELELNKNLDIKFFYSSLRIPLKYNFKNVKKYILPQSLIEILFNQYHKLPIEYFLGNLDVYHSSDWLQPKTKAKKVTTYHDIIPLKYPQWSHPKIVEVHRRRLNLVEEEIDCVIAVSNSTKEDLLECTKIPDHKIRVIYEGVDKTFKVQDGRKVGEFKKKYKLPDQYILAIGGIGKRRNLDKVKEACKGFNLIITGETIPYLPHDQMLLLYCGAQALLYPSLYEGFGLPIIEAFACGCPVITSNISSMAEIGKDAALLVDPFNIEEIKKALKEILNNKSLRESLIKKGLKRAASFSWEKCGEETVKVYKELVDQK